VSLTKDASPFAQPRFIEPTAAKLFKGLASEGRLIDVSSRDLPARLAFYFGELNALHPFREGNGRAQRLFWGQVLELRGLSLNWDSVSREEMTAASAAVHLQTEEPLRRLFDRIIEPI
jgi:cell filamentation protein